ncbi:hypothetical protein AMIS_1600 [Actinoplanes missouriensis 431]|uniref:GlcNAc-PI de-N-acetylase n=1 Tax=Actinoplanes missouriensis (strain ATCC 14538 / DSM 43046 / CBS 188.64 / JCM 3121 / NBRC 102363 / NCIMB 12654 / NRRL B-3342 / UNCC 431) TaxID=512565 RepID=I0GX93_ACTM4|nr:PIG-L family deacetylase [Actinoplanes missouriensis]BAL85380.1 hypothetical protein AMIS_1600 [Actinoplanes missouriensis 431]
MSLFQRKRGVRFTAAWPSGSHVQIVAHCDDDLYFMNPALFHAVRAGAPSTSVYLTAGEADGRNAPSDAPDRGNHPVDHAGYAAARRNGIRSAYAQMVTGNRDSRWTTRPATYVGVTVDVSVLDEAPHVRLVFVSLMGQEAARRGDPSRAIDALWRGDIPDLTMLVPTGSTVPRQELSRDDLIDVLLAILAETRPTVVRVMDPDPDHTTYERGVRINYSDHSGHTAAAHFAMYAVRRFERDQSRNVLVESYRGYYNRHWPRNLTAAAFQTKLEFLDTYGGTHGDRTGEIGCGDYMVGDKASTTGYGQSTTQRYPGTTSWLRRLADGRLAAFAVLGGHVHVWQETAPGSGTWAAPVLLPGHGDLTPHIDVTAGSDGRLHLVGVRQPLTPSPLGQHRIIVVATQPAPGAPFGGWTELGNPADDAADRTLRMREMGMPVAAVRPDGMLQIFVRNFGRGVSSRVQNGPPGKTTDQPELTVGRKEFDQLEPVVLRQ